MQGPREGFVELWRNAEAAGTWAWQGALGANHERAARTKRTCQFRIVFVGPLLVGPCSLEHILAVVAEEREEGAWKLYYA